jgi:hypothetical protein
VLSAPRRARRWRVLSPIDCFALSCSRVHSPEDPCLGEPLCPDCFDYEGAVIWNNLLGELWRRTTIYLPRKLAKLTGITQKRLHERVRVSYVKETVSEYQHRGLVHLHPVIRLDRRMPAYRKGEIRPPDKRFTSELLEHALRATVEDVKVEIPDELDTGTVRWGQQLDVQQLPAEDHKRRGKAGPLTHLRERFPVRMLSGMRWLIGLGSAK